MTDEARFFASLLFSYHSHGVSHTKCSVKKVGWWSTWQTWFHSPVNSESKSLLMFCGFTKRDGKIICPLRPSKYGDCFTFHYYYMQMYWVTEGCLVPHLMYSECDGACAEDKGFFAKLLESVSLFCCCHTSCCVSWFTFTITRSMPGRAVIKYAASVKLLHQLIETKPTEERERETWSLTGHFALKDLS